MFAFFVGDRLLALKLEQNTTKKGPKNDQHVTKAVATNDMIFDTDPGVILKPKEFQN